jgi:alkanesulfonate monooxygenase SsuD/methylene tetrahydromethanopterin reductase-like flavin-dependent oxidoreductase (luciferase family)
MPVTSEGRVALYLQDLHPVPDAIEYVRHAEARGFEAVWQAESRLVREATVPMAAFAATTERIKIGSGVVNCWTRNVGLMAATFVTLDDLAPGRVMLGLVVGAARHEGRGATRASPDRDARVHRRGPPSDRDGERDVPRRVRGRG